MRGDLMRPVRPLDVPGVVWTMAWSLAGTRLPRPVRLALAVASLPLWSMTFLFMSGLRHGAEGRVVARLTPRTPRARARAVAQSALAVLAILAASIGLGVLAAGTRAVGLACAVVVVATSVVSLVLLTGLVARQAAERSSTPPATSTLTRRQDQHRWKHAGWQLDCVASRLPVGGLALVAEHVRDVVPPDASIRTEATSTKHAAVYARYGLRPLPSKPLHLLIDT